MIVVTGAAGFIGSCLISRLEEAGVREVVAVDDFTREDKNLNLKAKNLALLVDRMHFFNWLTENRQRVDFIFIWGARTDTTEFDVSVFDALNLNYTKELWRQCTAYAIPLIYASSAATYGGGELGYEDDHSLVEKLKPLNPYGDSKNEFDKWMLKQTATPPFWAGFKFFNVYGPNEYHKGRMASVVMHSFNQIRDTGRVKLFRSHRPDFADGMQLRDFIYVGDVVEVMYEMSLKRPQPGIYNLGTGTARAFLHLANAVFAALDLEPQIDFVDTPADIRDKYQYFTEAPMSKLRNAGITFPFRSLEEGVKEYVQKYLKDGVYC